MGLLARTRDTAPMPAPAKRIRRGVSREALEGAIAAVTSAMADCTARQTIDALFALTDESAGDIVKLDGPVPVTIMQLDDALAEAQKFELPAGTLAPLTRLRALLAEAETQKAKEPAQYVTVAQLKAHDVALFDAFGWALGAVVEELSRSQPTQAHVLATLERSASTPERKKVLNGICDSRAADVPRHSPGQPWSTV